MHAKTSFKYLLARGLPGILSLASVGIFSRLLTESEYGFYSLMFLSVVFLDAVFFNWIGVSFVRFYKVDTNESNTRLLTTAQRSLGAVSFFFAALICGGFLLFYDGPDKWLLTIVMALLLFFEPAHTFNQKIAIAKIKPDRFGSIAFLKAGVFLIVGYSAAYYNYGALAPLIGLLAGAAISYVYLPTLREWRFSLTTPVDVQLLKRMFTYGAPLTISFALSFFLSFADRYLLAAMTDTRSAGIYAAGYDIANLSMGVLMTLNMALYPIALRELEKNGSEAARKELQRTLSILLVGALPIALVFLVHPNAVADLMIGEKFRSGAVEVLPIISAGALFAGLRSYWCDLSFHFAQRTWPTICVVSTAAIVNLILNLFLIPEYGIVGAAWATLTAYITAFFLSVILGYIFGFRLPVPGSDSIRILSSAVAAGIILSLLPAGQTWSVIPIGLASLGLFIFFTYVTRVTYTLKAFDQALHFIRQKR